MLIAVVNRSSKVTDSQASTMARGVDWQARHHIAPAWHLTPPKVRFYRAGEAVPAEAVECLIADAADAADALGYHDQSPTGRPYLRVFVDVTLGAGGGVLDARGGLAVSTVLSHEVAEALGDPECNRWAQRPDGRLICLELGDPVQGRGYDVEVVTGRRRERVAVSDFVHPSWFDTAPELGATFDQLGAVAAPFTLDAGGYQIWTDGKAYGNEFGSLAAFDQLAPRAADKLHPAARTRRRYDRLEALGAAPDPRGYVAPPMPPA